MLSVLVVSPDPSVPGGVSVFIEGMKRHVTRSCIDSFFIGSSGKGGEPLWNTVKRVLITPLKLARLVKEKNYDAVHINPSFDAKSLIRDGLFVLALRAVGYRRILFYFHGWDSCVQSKIGGNILLRSVVAWVLNRAALIAVLGAEFRNGLTAMGVDSARVVVTHTMFEGDALQTGDAARPASRPFILFLSRFDREKGGRELIDAFAEVAEDYPDLDLVMAGDGADASFLQAQAENLGIKKRVLFTGYIGGSEKARLLRDCTIFALPTYYRSEGMPVAVLEAMGAGKPLLVGSAGSITSIVSEPENGIVLKDITSQTVEAGLRRLLENNAFAASAGKRNAEIAWKKYEAHIVTAMIEDFYQRVASC